MGSTQGRYTRLRVCPKYYKQSFICRDVWCEYFFVCFWFSLNCSSRQHRSSVRLFADDCVLYRDINSPKDCQILQKVLDSLARWETDWQMKFNVAKCHSVRMTR